MSAHLHHRTTVSSVALFLAAALFTASADAQTTPHKLVPIELPIGAVDINDGGYVAGTSSDGRPAVWKNGAVVDLGAPFGIFGAAVAINSRGDVVGTSCEALGSACHVIVWQKGSTTDLGPTYSDVPHVGINDSGVVIATPYSSPVLWRDGNLFDLDTLIDPGSKWHLRTASAINKDGGIVGWGYHDLQPRAYLLYSNVLFTVIYDLGTLDSPSSIYYTSEATGINNLGQVVGAADPTLGATHGFLWNGFGTPMTDLGPIGGGFAIGNGGSYGQVADINDFGQIVGWEWGSPVGFVPFLWQDGHRMDLDTLIDPSAGWTLTTATAINNAGQIVGSGTHDGHPASFLLDLNACVDTDGNGNPDNDGDGLCDNWETEGIDVDHDGVIDLKLYDVNQNGVIDASEQADPNHKDIYVEIDWMAQHKPAHEALRRVVDSFANAPSIVNIPGGTKGMMNPDGTKGIRLHLVVDEEVDHQDQVQFDPATPPTYPNFDDIKAGHFGTPAERSGAQALKLLAAKRLVFRYALFAHSLSESGVDGEGEFGGNDFVVSLGAYPSIGGHGVGTVDQQAAAFMHELGHTLFLAHGGFENANCKPNYLSIMSYTRVYDGVPIVGRPLDYSRQALWSLDESDLSEPNGIQVSDVGPQPLPGPIKTTFWDATRKKWHTLVTDGPVDWNQDGDVSDEHVTATLVGPKCDPPFEHTFEGYDDWYNLRYDFRESPDFADLARSTLADQPPELTFEQAVEMSPDTDGDGVTNLIDNCMLLANPDQADADQDGVGDACDNCVNASNPSQTDADRDGCGNACDADLNQTGYVEGADFNSFRRCFGQTLPGSGPASDPTCAESDLDDDGVVTTADRDALAAQLGRRPGPSADPNRNRKACP